MIASSFSIFSAPYKTQVVRRLCALILGVVMFNTNLSADDETFTVGGFTYDVVYLNTCRLTGVDKNLRTVIVPSEVVNPEDGMTYSVIEISPTCFFDEDSNSLWESVTIPSSVSEFGWDFAFRGCKNLKSVSCASAIIRKLTFSGLTSLESVILTEDVREIGWQCFGVCTSLVEINLPNSIVK